MAKAKSDSEMHSRYRKVRVNGMTVQVHRYVMEQSLGRPLRPDEVVHHINGNRYDNRIENLQLMTVSHHSRMENLGRPAHNKGKPLSEEQKAKLRAFHLGKKLSPEHRAQISAGVRRAYTNPDFRAKISTSLIGNQRTKGYHHSPEALAKISEASKRARREKFWSTRPKK